MIHKWIAIWYYNLNYYWEIDKKYGLKSNHHHRVECIGHHKKTGEMIKIRANAFCVYSDAREWEIIDDLRLKLRGFGWPVRLHGKTIETIMKKREGL